MRSWPSWSSHFLSREKKYLLGRTDQASSFGKSAGGKISRSSHIQRVLRDAMGYWRISDILRCPLFRRFQGRSERNVLGLGRHLPEITFHALRHTHASQLIDAGVDIVTISKRLGHAKPSVTLAIYAHLFRTDDSKAANAINAALSVS